MTTQPKTIETLVYAFQPQGLERSLGRLLEKIHDQGQRVVMFFDDAQDLDHFNTTLWTFASLSFLPHGKETSPQPDAQPILLSTQGATVKDPPNKASIGVAFSAEGLSTLQQNPGLRKRILVLQAPQAKDLDLAALPGTQESTKAVLHTQTSKGGWESLDLKASG